MQLFAQLHARHGMALVMVTHNPELVRDFDRALAMGPGGAMSEVASHPAGPVRA